MQEVKLNEVIIPTDRWSARVVSPVEISKGINADKYREVVVVHPGWGKTPERHGALLLELAEHGFLPLGIDTRYGYSDRKQPRTSFWSQPHTVGVTNPHFPVNSPEQNRWVYRRPTVLLDVCERLGVEKRSYIGHSEGGRIATLATVAAPENVSSLIIVNGAGMGDSSDGASGLMHSSANRIRDFAGGQGGIIEAAKSVVGSIAYAATHLRRTLAEKQVIQSADTWASIDQLQETGVSVTVLHARDDELISFQDCEASAASREWAKFVPTLGSHGNVYEVFVRNLVIASLEQ